MIYVFNRIGSLEFNTLVYCLMRPWHLPDLPNLPAVDTWFAVPAVKIGPIYNIINANFDLAALMIVDEEGRVVKSHRVNLNLAPKVQGYDLEELKLQAFDIPLWEQTNQKEFPYSTMFDPSRIGQRYSALNPTDNKAMLSSVSTNVVYNKIRETVQPKPCNCGKGRKA